MFKCSKADDRSSVYLKPVGLKAYSLTAEASQVHVEFPSTCFVTSFGQKSVEKRDTKNIKKKFHFIDVSEGQILNIVMHQYFNTFSIEYLSRAY